MDVLTINELGKAISHVLNICKEKAEEKANIVMDFFGYEERIIDNCILPGERRLFYVLERKGLLVTEGEKAILFNGRTWRIHYWRLNKENIYHYAHVKKWNGNKKTLKKEMVDNIYLHLPRDMWFSRKNHYFS